jgi:hypothetical protein
MPNAMSSVCVFIDGFDGNDASGSLYALGGTAKSTFSSLAEMVITCDKLLSSASVVQASFGDRDFSPASKNRGSDPQIPIPEQSPDMSELAKKATFVIHINQRLNATWQGEITWVSRGIMREFLSSLDMIKLIEQALGYEYGMDIKTGWK